MLAKKKLTKTKLLGCHYNNYTETVSVLRLKSFLKTKIGFCWV